MATTEKLTIVVLGKDMTKKAFAGVKKGMSGLASGGKKVAAVMGKVMVAGAVAAAAAVTALSAAIVRLTVDAAKAEGTINTFDRLASSIGATSDAMIKDLRKATRGMVADVDLMQAANKFMAMGLAKTSDEAYKLAEMATQLGMAMGNDATRSMEDFALMLANQSIERLDSFTISAGEARRRIEELTGSTEDSSEAFGDKTSKIAKLQGQLEIVKLRMSEYTDTTKESTKAQGLMRFNELNQQIRDEQAELAKLGESMNSAAAATGNMTREEAFLQVTLEMGAESMKRVGEQGDTAGASMARVKAKFDNITMTIGQAFLPVFAKVMTFFSDLIDKYAPPVIEFVKRLAGGLGNLPGPMQEVVKEAKAMILTIKEFWDKHGKVIMDLVKGWLSWLVTTFQIAFRVISGVVKVAGFLMSGEWKSAMAEIRITSQNVWDIITGWWESKGKRLTYAIWHPIEVAVLKIRALWYQIGPFFDQLAYKIDQKMLQIKNEIRLDLLEIAKAWQSVFLNISKIPELYLERWLWYWRGIFDQLVSIAVGGFGKLRTALRNGANSIVEAFKSALGISSPSKVFQSIGESMMDGLALGISNAAGKPVAAMGQALSATAIAAYGTAGFSGFSGQAAAAAAGGATWDSYMEPILNSLRLSGRIAGGDTSRPAGGYSGYSEAGPPGQRQQLTSYGGINFYGVEGQADVLKVLQEYFG